MKRILITGATGFIGRHLMRELAGRFELIGTSFSLGLDLSLLPLVDSIQEQYDAVVHLAGLSFVPDSNMDPYRFYQTNFACALNIAELCRRRCVPLLIYPNTYVYGEPERLPIDEEHRIALPSHYHKSKMLTENLLRGYFLPGQTQVITLRLFNVYGCFQNPKYLIPQITHGARTYRRVTVRDLEPRRDFLHISDLVRLVGLILDHESPGTATYNVGSGRSHSVAEVIAICGDLLGHNLQVDHLNDRRPNEIMDCYADITKVKHKFGWQPERSIHEGLREILCTKHDV